MEQETNWLNLYENMNEGKVDYNAKFYVAQDMSQEGNGDIKLVTPTQAQVDQAKVQIKRKLSFAENVLPKPKRKKKTQTGGGRKATKKPSRRRKPSQKGGRKSRKVTKRPAKRVVKKGRAKRRKR